MIHILGLLVMFVDPAVVFVMTFSTLFRLALPILWSDLNAVVRLKLKQFGIPALLNVLNWIFLYVINFIVLTEKEKTSNYVYFSKS